MRPFERKQGVLTFGHPEAMHKRNYRSILVPHALCERVVNGLTVK
ncbi:MAG: hypothetical protein ABR976_21340 [Terracidiphilus sp.]|jgi:hypothetical protein